MVISLKVMIFLFIALSFSSCSILKTYTAKAVDIYGEGVIQKPVVVDLDVKETKVTGSVTANAGTPVSSMKVNAVADAIKNANADVLVEPRFETVTTNGKTTVTVLGFPASYKNFRSITPADTALLRVGVSKKIATYESTAEGGKKKSGIGATIGILAGVGTLFLVLLGI